MAVTTLRRGPAIGSDHYPLIADLRLLGPEPRLNAAAPQLQGPERVRGMRERPGRRARPPPTL